MEFESAMKRTDFDEVVRTDPKYGPTNRRVELKPERQKGNSEPQVPPPFRQDGIFQALKSAGLK